MREIKVIIDPKRRRPDKCLWVEVQETGPHGHHTYTKVISGKEEKFLIKILELPGVTGNRLS